MEASRRVFLKGSAAAAAWWPWAGGSLFAQSGTDATGRFLAAVQTGDADAVVRLLSADPALVGATDAQRRTAFALAHLHGHPAIGALLRTRGYQPDLHESALALDWPRFEALTAKDAAMAAAGHPIGGTAMFAAAAGGAGADIWRVYAVDVEPNLAHPAGGVSPLQRALRYPDVSIAEMTAANILSNAGDPNPAGGADDPPLHLAARIGSVEMVEMLVRHGAAVGARDRDGRTAEDVAAAAGHRAVAAMLSRHGDIPRTHSTSRTAYDATGLRYTPPDLRDIPQATRSRFVGQAHFSLDFVTGGVAADPRLVHSMATNGEISVEACAHTGRRPVVDFLLEHGAPYSLPTAVMRNDRARATALLDEDPRRIHERGAHDFALLWYPIIGRCDVAMLELLLARGAEVERQHLLGTTALHWASQGGQLDMMELLIAHGADVNRPGRKFGPTPETPLGAAVRGKQEAAARLLRDRGAKQ